MAHSKAPVPVGSLSLEEALALVPPALHPLTEGIQPRRVARMVELLWDRLGSVVLVAEAVRRRHNVSAILRTADAFGLHEVHLVAGEFRPSHGASRGSERWLDVHRCPSPEACLDDLRGRGFRVFVADLLPGALAPEEVPVDRPLALLFGSELSGVSAAARARADGAVAVPMRGFVESLNVSVAAAIIARSAAERRRALRGPDLDPAARLAALELWLRREDRYQAAAKRRTGRVS